MYRSNYRATIQLSVVIRSSGLQASRTTVSASANQLDCLTSVGGLHILWVMITPPERYYLLLLLAGTAACSDRSGGNTDGEAGGSDTSEDSDGTALEWDIAADSPVPPDFCSFDPPQTTFGPPGSCGYMKGMEPVTGCSFEFAGSGQPSMLCDPDGQHCMSPDQSCKDGWCWVPASSFLAGRSVDLDLTLGSTTPESQFFDPPRRVRIDYPFWIQQSEVTRSQFLSVMGYQHPNPTDCDGDCPAAVSTVFEAMHFANRLGELWDLPACYTLIDCGFETMRHEQRPDLTIQVWKCDQASAVGPSCRGLRLPRQLEAELAARAGSAFCTPSGRLSEEPPAEPWTAVCASTSPVSQYCWYCGNAIASTPDCNTGTETTPECLVPQPIRALHANPFGIFDLEGNVMEFTENVGCTAIDDGSTCVSGSEFASSRTTPIRHDDVFWAYGGSFLGTEAGCCTSIRSPVATHYNVYALQLVGFRLVRTDHNECED